jgi:phospholipid-transporting ATPase
LIILGVCHTVVCDRELKDPDKPESLDNPESIVYQSSSPDELALVTAAKEIGYELVGRSTDGCEVYNKIIDVTEKFEVICEFPFTSDRKRMSLIIKDNGVYYMYSKGADSVMMPKIKFDQDQDDEQQNIHKFATEGLRVLVIGYKTFTEQEFEDFKTKYDKLRSSKAKSREDDLYKLYDQMETQLNLIGCTAIEDKLQDGVPETIGLLREAEISIWMLTGDKMETAIEIAKSCNLFDDKMTELMFSFDSLEMITQTIDSELKYLELKELFNETETIAVVVDGSTLQIIFQNPKVTDSFFKLCRASKSVVCCRVSPKQKSDIVDNYMKSQKGICIAIGDGANDVPMIMQAHIGVGIRGLEGTQAVRISDFAINQFSHLQKLLLVHGRWGYRRVAYMVCYYFYKNIVLALCEIYFHLFNGFSGQIFFLDWLPLLYNSFFTSFPCLFTYCFEQDANIENSYLYPELYKAGRKHVYFNMKVFWKWIIFSIWHGLVSFFLPMYSTRAVLGDGMTSEHWYSSTIAFTIIVHLVTMKLFIESIFWSWLSVLMAILSLFVYYLILVIGSSEIFSYTFQQQATGLLVQSFGSLHFWILALIGPFIGLLPDLAYKFISVMYWPNPADVIVAEQKGKREAINERAKARARKRNLYQPTSTGKKRRNKLMNEGEGSEEFEEEEEEEESEIEEEEGYDHSKDDIENGNKTPAKVTPDKGKSSRKNRNLDKYAKVNDQDEDEFDSIDRPKKVY